MPSASKHELIMEKTPVYFTSPIIDLPARIKKDLPNAKLILVLCDPVKRSYSDYTHEVLSYKNQFTFFSCNKLIMKASLLFSLESTLRNIQAQ